MNKQKIHPLNKAIKSLEMAHIAVLSELEDFIFANANHVLKKTFGLEEGDSVVVEDAVRLNGLQTKPRKFKIKISQKSLLKFVSRFQITDLINREDVSAYLFREMQSYFFGNYGSLIAEEDKDALFCVKAIKQFRNKTLWEAAKMKIEERVENFPYILYFGKRDCED